MTMIMKRLWFKQKTYGWGWVPASWQGWLVVALYVAAVGGFPVYWKRAGVEFDAMAFISLVIGLTFILVGVCMATGERPGWRWGAKKQLNNKKKK